MARSAATTAGSGTGGGTGGFEIAECDIGNVIVGFDHLSADDVPTVEPFDRRAAALAEPPAQVGVPEHAQHRLCELTRVVPDQNVLFVDRRETLATNRRADDGLTHGPRVEDFQSGAAAHPERHDVARGVAHERPDVLDVAGQLHAVSLPVVPLLLSRRPPNPTRRAIS